MNSRSSMLSVLIVAILATGCSSPATTETIIHSCGQGTLELNGTCLLITYSKGSNPSQECGVGTERIGDECLPAAGLYYSAGETPETAEPDAPSLRTCGEGTSLLDGQCLPVESDTVRCGRGSYESDGECLSHGRACGDGAHEVEGACVLDRQPVFCGPNTAAVDGVCLPSRVIECGEGTVADDGECVPELESLLCGAGTLEEDGECVLNEAWVPCGAGTLELDGACVRDEGHPLAHTYELRAPVDEFPGDGMSQIPLMAYGRNIRGEPSVEAVVIWSDRNGGGRLRPGFTALKATGKRLWFEPCSDEEEACLGPIQFHMALASDPDRIVASTQQIQIVAPTGVASMAPCRQGGSTFFTSGHPDHPVVKKNRLLQRADIVTGAVAGPGDPVTFQVFPDAQADGKPLVVTVANSEVGTYFDDALVIETDEWNCTGGDYQIHSIAIDWQQDGTGEVVSLEASWTLECAAPIGESYPPLVGCVRLDPNVRR